MSVDLTIESQGLFLESRMRMFFKFPEGNWVNLQEGGQRAVTMQVEL